jgi:hypothetical protein
MSAEPKNLPLIVVITGATGVIYGVEMLRVLKERGRETHLIVSEAAGLNLRGGPLDDVISVPPSVETPAMYTYLRYPSGRQISNLKAVLHIWPKPLVSFMMINPVAKRLYRKF